MIAAMRQREYPGSDIILEKELDPGANYSRYYASYLSEGLKIYALLTIPNGEPPAAGWPVIIFNHGYIPPSQYRTTGRYVAYVDRLAQAGYIVLRSDYRGHDQSEGAAQGAYLVAKQQWEQAAQHMAQVLNSLVGVIGDAHQNYSGAERANSSIWT